MKKVEKRKIVFYDGSCPFCNKTVKLILENNKGQNIYFSSLQSEFSKDFFGEYRIDLSTFYFYDDFQLYSKSKAALRLSRYLSRPYSFMRIFALVPVCFRDKVYDFIAKKRNNILKEYCFNPSDEVKKRFIE